MLHDDFDMMIQPEELQCDHPIDEDDDFAPRWADEEDWEEDDDINYDEWEGL